MRTFRKETASMKCVIIRVVLASAVLVLGSAPALAQEEPTVWGVIGGFAPQWKMPDGSIRKLFDLEAADVTGSEFRIGFVRGHEFGGDWGVSFVQKRFNDDSRIVRFGDFDEGIDNLWARLPFVRGFSYTLVDTLVPVDTTLRGVEIHRYANFATI